MMYPESEKLEQFQSRNASQVLGEFIEWLMHHPKYSICHEINAPDGLALIGEAFSGRERADDDDGPVTQVWWPAPLPGDVIALFAGVDQAKLEQEKGDMLDVLRRDGDKVMGGSSL